MVNGKQGRRDAAGHRITIKVVIPAVLMAAAFACPAMPQQPEDLNRRIDSLIATWADPKLGGQAPSFGNPGDEETRKAFRALVAIGKPAVPKLINAVLGENQIVAIYCSYVLEKIGQDALPAMRERWNRLTDAEKWKLMSFRGKFDYENSLPFALSSLESKDPAIRSQAQGYLCLHRGPVLNRRS